MNNVGFGTTDFVLVEHIHKLENDEPATFWRHALYVTNQDGCHVVIYTDGTKEVLSKTQRVLRVDWMGR